MTNSFPAERVAKTICEIGGWNVSNLQLQKIMYVGNLISLGREKKSLVDSSFSAWDYGPVIPDIYHKVKKYGYSPIGKESFDDSITTIGATDNEKEKETRELLESVCSALLKENPNRLIDLTHREGGAWFVTGRNGIIEEDDILNEYQKFYQKRDE